MANLLPADMAYCQLSLRNAERGIWKELWQPALEGGAVFLDCSLEIKFRHVVALLSCGPTPMH